MANYALVKNGNVFNIVVWDGESEVDFGAGVTSVLIEDGVAVSIGDAYSGGKFTAAPLTEEEQEALNAAAKTINIATKDSMMAEASQRISVLQDAVDLEMATDEEAAALPLWKKYRVLLSRVDANTADAIDWPAKPE